MRTLALLLTLFCLPVAASSDVRQVASPVAPSPARALPRAERPAVARFLVVPLTEMAPSRVEAVYTALTSAGASVVDRSARAGVDLPPAPALREEATLDEPRAALLAARASLRALALDDVDDSLAQALDAALRLANPSEHTDLLADILLLRAEMALARNLPEVAQRDLRLLARVDERRVELHPGLFPPNVVAAYASARAANTDAPPAFVSLHADATGASLVALLDGRELAAADARAGIDVKEGPHVVTLLAPGRVSRSFLIEASATEPLTLEVQLFPPHADEARAAALRELRAAPGDEESSRRLLETTGASALLLLDDASGRVFTPERGAVALATTGDARTADALALARAALLATEPPAEQQGQLAANAPPAPKPAEDGFSPATLALAGGAVVVVLLAAGAGIGALAFALQPGEDIPPPPVPVVGTGLGQGR